MTKGTMADLKTLFSEEAAQCRRLAEIATEEGIGCACVRQTRPARAELFPA